MQAHLSNIAILHGFESKIKRLRDALHLTQTGQWGYYTGARKKVKPTAVKITETLFTRGNQCFVCLFLSDTLDTSEKFSHRVGF